MDENTSTSLELAEDDFLQPRFPNLLQFDARARQSRYVGILHADQSRFPHCRRRFKNRSKLHFISQASPTRVETSGVTMIRGEDGRVYFENEDGTVGSLIRPDARNRLIRSVSAILPFGRPSFPVRSTQLSTWSMPSRLVYSPSFPTDSRSTLKGPRRLLHGRPPDYRLRLRLSMPGRFAHSRNRHPPILRQESTLSTSIRCLTRQRTT